MQRAKWRQARPITALKALAQTGPSTAPPTAISASGPPSDPVAAALQEGLLRVTVYRVALVPAALLALAVPVLAARARPRPRSLPEPGWAVSR